MDSLSARIKAFILDAHLNGFNVSVFKKEIKDFSKELELLEEDRERTREHLRAVCQENSELRDQIAKLEKAATAWEEAPKVVSKPNCSKCGSDNGAFCTKCVQVPELKKTIELEQAKKMVKEIVQDRPKDQIPHKGKCLICKQEKGWRALKKAQNGTWSCLKIEECVRSISVDEPDERKPHPLKPTSDTIDYFHRRLSTEYGFKPFEVAQAMVISDLEIDDTESLLRKLEKQDLAEKLPNPDKKPEHFQKWRLTKVAAA